MGAREQGAREHAKHIDTWARKTRWHVSTFLARRACNLGDSLGFMLWNIFWYILTFFYCALLLLLWFHQLLWLVVCNYFFKLIKYTTIAIFFVGHSIYSLYFNCFWNFSNVINFIHQILFHRYKFSRPAKALDVANISFYNFQPNFYLAGIKFPVEKKNIQSYKTDNIFPLNA